MQPGELQRYDYGMQKKIEKKRKYGDYFTEKKMNFLPEEEGETVEIAKEFKRFRLNPD